MPGNVGCVLRNGTGIPCCVRVIGSGSTEGSEEHSLTADGEVSCNLDAASLSHIAAWYTSQPPPNTHIFPAGASSAVVELTASLTSNASVGTAGTDEKQKLTFVNQCSVDVWFRLFLNDDYKDRLVFAGQSETYEFEEQHVTSFGAKFQYPPKNGVSDYRWNPAHEAKVVGKEVTITFQPTIAMNMSDCTPCTGKISTCVLRNGTSIPCCVRVIGSGSTEGSEEHSLTADGEVSCNLDAASLSHIAAWYTSQPPPNTHIFPAGASSAVVELTASLTSNASVGTAGTDEKQKLTFVNQCSVDVWFRLFLNDDYKDRLVFAGQSETYEFEEQHVTSFGAKFQYPPKNGVSDYRWNPAHEAKVVGKEVTITFQPTVAFKMTEFKMGQAKLVQDLFHKYDKSGDGILSEEEMLGIFEALSVPKTEVQALFQQADANRDGKIQVQEFIAWLMTEPAAPKGD
ncbi:unnamed protein product [Symbiodinium sp. CCMP2592]|nr:unnamed protein product [Symbiodinium sp. CCMP2592]